MTLTGASGDLRADRWNGDGWRGALLMLHGGGQTRHSWDRAARLLAGDGWQVFTLDARGHGESAWAPDGDYSIDGFVADYLLVAAQVRDLCGMAVPPVVIGASLGGMTALVGEGEHGDTARALVLVDIAPRIEPSGAERVGVFMRSASGGFESLVEVADAVAAYQPQRTRPANHDNLRRNVRQAEDGRLYWHWDPAFLRFGDAARGEGFHHERLSEAARRVRVPTLLVRGGKSDMVSDDAVDELLQLIPAATVVDVAGAAHMVAGDDNAVFVEQMTGFLHALPAADRA
ncbi:alpha/beta fold hydrolase [[Mycobacterium] vasticus]|uniref:Alpha/beta fold hydrolase n=1 Tax=[Mycobacterium] vasticus TaxID=2875777 RepID=A0ABU5Z2T8_9MYCO|nr:alpha/beta fold hydrolase [Mycolicibacter sp. MYC017]MEB3071706.1 alpha/beta fold hydrolase [Mycolicibacter sp. MYC017]